MSSAVPSYFIQQLPQTARPIERLLRYGPKALSIAELIANVLGSETKDTPVLSSALKDIFRCANREEFFHE